MIKNYLKIAFRNLSRNKAFTVINVIGLSIGISAALVIYLIVQYDLNFDKFEKDRDRIYHVVTNFKFVGVPYKNGGVPQPLAEAVRKEVSGLDVTSAFFTYDDDVKVQVTSTTTGKPIILKKQPNLIFADAHYFNIINYQWLAGAATTALNNPHSVVLTQSRAKTYFPSLPAAEVMGKEIIYNDSVRAIVTGIVADITKNTDFIFTDFISQATISAGGLKNNYSWGEWTNTNGNSQLFVKLSKGTSTLSVESRFKTLVKKYRPADNKDEKNTTSFNLQPLNQLHFNSEYCYFGDHKAHLPTLYGLCVVAVFLLLLGCINFINLTTAQASQRAKEIGIRKTMGSTRLQLITQFLTETFLLTLAATVLSIVLTPLLLKVFASFIPNGLRFSLIQQPQVILFLVLLIVTVSLLSGFYPALVLSKYNPVLVLKGNTSANTGSTRKTILRRSLTVSQFIIAQVFIMASLIVSKQIYYTLNKDLGFKKEAIIYVQAPWNDRAGDNRFVLANELNTMPGIQMLSLGGDVPSSNGTNSGTMKYTDGKKEIETDVHYKYGDTNYLKLYKIKLVAGRNITASDTAREFIINETYARVLGFQNPRDAINKYIGWSGRVMPIVGVITDFNQQSLHEPIKPLAFTTGKGNYYTFHIALKPQNAEGNAWAATIKQVEKAYKRIYPEYDFEYQFYDASIAKFYKSEQDISTLLKWATGLVIFISCLGLLGLVMYTTNQRRKEIGVRKVLGASISHIVTILSKDFLQLVLVAFLIATPLAWWAMNQWLQNFAYRTGISWWVFVSSGTAMIAIAFITLSIQTIKAASANPVKSLRSE